MRNRHKWQATKYVPAGDGLAASGDTTQVSLGSKLIVDILGEEYAVALKRYAGGSVLDLGCGDAPLYGLYKELATEVVCIDWANTYHQRIHLDLEHDLNTPLPIAAQAFDTVLLTDVLEHLYSPQVLLAETARVLRPNGKLIAGVPFLYGIHEEPHDYCRYTEFKLRRLCQDNALEVIDLHSYGGALDVVMDITSKMLGFSRFACSIHLRAAKLAASTTLGRRVRAATAWRFPLGYILVAQKKEQQPSPLNSL